MYRSGPCAPMSGRHRGNPIKVLLTSCETGPGAWRHQEEILRAHFPEGDPGFLLTEDARTADLIFVSDLRPENDWEKLRRNKHIRRFPEKTYAIGDGDEMPHFCQGIFTSLTRSRWDTGRFRSGAYTLHHPDFLNPFVESWYAERGNRPAPPAKEYLASFSGRNCIPLRGRLLRMPWRRKDIFISDTSKTFDAFTHQAHGKQDAQERYTAVAIRSKFMLCPRGNGATSIRFFEAMQLGIAPVLISDTWVLPDGPDWEKCILRIAEDRLGDLEDLLVRHEQNAEAIGRAAQAAYTRYFERGAYLRYLVDAAVSIRRHRALAPERFFHAAWTPLQLTRKIVRRVQRLRHRWPGARVTVGS
jgi:hypothetical protein